MTRVLVAGVDTSTQSTKVRITDAATGEQVRFGQAKHPDGTSVNPEFWWEAFTKAVLCICMNSKISLFMVHHIAQEPS